MGRDPDDLPLLFSERMILRLPRPSDAAAIVRYLESNREHLAATSPPRQREYYTREYWRRIPEALTREYRDDRGLRFVICLRDEPRRICGMAHFGQILRGPFQACYLGYELAADKQGRGLMTEALRTAIDFVFGQRNLHRIMANYLPENVRSARVLEKLGFVKEGEARKYLFIDGAWRDHVLTSLTNDHWREPAGFRGV